MHTANGRPSQGKFRHLQAKHLGVDVVVAAAVVLTLFAVSLRDPLTHRELSFTPEGDGTSYYSYQYNDRDNGGTSVVTPDQSRHLAWTCDVSKTYEYGYCGFGTTFDLASSGRGIDLNAFDRAEVTLRYAGSGRSLRLVLKDKDPRYAKLGAASDEKLNQASVPVTAGVQTIEVALNQFAVAEWWRDSAGRPSPELAMRNLHNVTAMELLTATDSPPGRQVLRIEKIAFHGQTIGAEQWYGGIALAWLLLIGSLLLHRRREVGRWRTELLGMMRATINTIPHMVWSLDRHGKSHFNGRWEDYTGVPPAGCSAAGLRSLIHREDLKRAFEEWRRGIRSGSEFNIELRIRHRSGAFRWVLACTVPFRDEANAIAAWHGTCTDVHDRVRAQEALRGSISNERRRSRQLKWTSEHDPLTRLPNRRAFEAWLEMAVRRADEGRTGIGLFVIDMDYFKHLNDTLGHAAGDELLRATAARLRRSVRRQDFVARIGGDEFAVIVPDLTCDSDLVAMGNAVAAAIQLPLDIDGQVIRPSASIGGAVFPDDPPGPYDFLKRADSALYALKRSGRGGFRLFESYMLEEVMNAAYQRTRARDAIADDRIFAFYQPKVRIHDDAVTGFEALLRYETAECSLELPDTIAEAFNDYELAAKIGELMQHQVARDVKAWIAEGVPFGRVSINASPAEFLRDDYAERLLEVLHRHDVPPDRIEIEVTEHAFMERGREYVGRALTVLKSSGVTISLDDFGTGHSSLSHMRDFPVDVIKIDRSYIALITQDPEAAALVAGVIHLAGSLGLEVVAEGVETERQLELLRTMGCHMAQGLLLGAPLGETSVADCLARGEPVRSVA